MSLDSPGPFATRKALEHWAEEHQVRHVLALCATVLLPDLPVLAQQLKGLEHALSGLALRDIGSREGALRYAGAGGRGLETALCEAAWERVRREAESVRRALEEEATRPEVLVDTVLAPLWTRLLEVRRVLRAQVSPRCRQARAQATWGFDEEAGALTWKERERVVRAGPEYGAIGVSTRVTFSGSGEGRVECSCTKRPPWRSV